MEEQGMERRKRFFRARLLILLPLFFFPPAVSRNAGLWAEEGESAGQSFPAEAVEGDPREHLEIRLETSSDNPLINNSWSVFVLVNHPFPSEVNVAPPRFPPALILERVRTETRMIRRNPPPVDGSPQSDRWTRVEFLFSPMMAGPVSLEPFTVSVPGRRQATPSLSVRFREQTRTVRRYNPRYAWQNPPQAVVLGKKTRLVLELSNWEPGKDVPEKIFRASVPRNVILDENPPLKISEGNFRYIITVIPLEGDRIAMDAFSFRSDIYTLAVPEISVNIRRAGPAAQEPTGFEPAEKAAAPVLPGEVSPPENPEKKTPEISFGKNRERVFSPLRGEHDKVIARVESLWNQNSRAPALAEIRRSERNSLIGPSFIPVRREMEEALDLGFTGDEPWHPLKISLISWAFIAFAVIVLATALFVFHPDPRARKENPSSRRRSGLIPIIIAGLFISLMFIVLEEGLGNYFPLGRLSSPKNAAVLRSGPAFRVPDPKGAVNAQFGEGQPVIIGDYQGEWCYAESPDGRSGWVPREAVITY